MLFIFYSLGNHSGVGRRGGGYAEKVKAVGEAFHTTKFVAQKYALPGICPAECIFKLYCFIR